MVPVLGAAQMVLQPQHREQEGWGGVGGAPACQQLLSVCEAVAIPTLPQGSGFSSALETRAVYLFRCLSRCHSAISLPPPLFQRDSCEMMH